ncbi:hypothetical protein [Hungatella hathewayi]|uniref:hypothetical protein n=1 Tax=Hungatella hathewayi TaxID=154046 RepID=UPI003566C342
MEETRIRKCTNAIPDIAFGDGMLKISCRIEERQITENDCEACINYRSKYIEYPIKVCSIELAEGLDLYKKSVGKIVRIKRCLEETEEKEYLGILLGEMFSCNAVSYKRKTGLLVVNPVLNPAIYVPELKKIVYGYESWWSFVQSQDEIKSISKDDVLRQFFIRILEENK